MGGDHTGAARCVEDWLPATFMEFAKRQLPQEWDSEPVLGVKTGSACARLIRGMLCAERKASAAVNAADDGDSCTGGGRGADCGGVAAARAGDACGGDILGIDELYQVGGAQAIAALAYGTATLPRVDKIVGPGNLYVTAAKRLVAFDCAIDMLAGPTEIVVTSERGHPEAIGADLVAQAEHDPRR